MNDYKETNTSLRIIWDAAQSILYNFTFKSCPKRFQYYILIGFFFGNLKLKTWIIKICYLSNIINIKKNLFLKEKDNKDLTDVVIIASRWCRICPKRKRNIYHKNNFLFYLSFHLMIFTFGCYSSTIFYLSSKVKLRIST